MAAIVNMDTIRDDANTVRSVKALDVQIRQVKERYETGRLRAHGLMMNILAHYIVNRDATIATRMMDEFRHLSIDRTAINVWFNTFAGINYASRGKGKDGASKGFHFTPMKVSAVSDPTMWDVNAAGKVFPLQDRADAILDAAHANPFYGCEKAKKEGKGSEPLDAADKFIKALKSYDKACASDTRDVIPLPAALEAQLRRTINDLELWHTQEMAVRTLNRFMSGDTVIDEDDTPDEAAEAA